MTNQSLYLVKTNWSNMYVVARNTREAISRVASNLKSIGVKPKDYEPSAVERIAFSGELVLPRRTHKTK